MLVPARGTELSPGGMALCVHLSLKRDDAIEVEFQTPSKVLVTGIVRNCTDHCFGPNPRARPLLLNRTRDR
jgi:hypothetical protein